MASGRSVARVAAAAGGLTVVAALIWHWDSSADDPDLKAAAEATPQREFARAASHLERYLADHPDDVSARLAIARLARRQQWYTVAAAHLRKFEELKGPKEQSELEYKLMKVQQGQLADVAALMERYGGGKPDADSLAVMEAVTIGVLQVLAPTPMVDTTLTPEYMPLLNLVRTATDRWLELRQSRQDQAAGFLWRGRIRTLSGDYAEGVEDLQRAVDLVPDDLEPRTYLAMAVLRNEPARAIDHLVFVRRRAVLAPELNFALATTYRRVGRLDDASRVLDEMLAADAKAISPLIERGLLALDQAHLDDADRYLRRALELAPAIPEVQLALGQYMQVRGDAARAKEHLERYHRLLSAKLGRPAGSPP